MTRTTEALHRLGQSLWLDNITRGLLDGGALARYIAELSVTGLTSDPTIVDEAIADEVIFEIERHGVDVAALGHQLQKDGAVAFDKSRRNLTAVLGTKVQAHA